MDSEITTPKPRKKKYFRKRRALGVAASKEEQLKSKIASKRTAISIYQKQLNNLVAAKVALKEEAGGIVSAEIYQDHKALARALEDSDNIVFKANPGPQTEFLAASEQEVFYGGARGGGKSYAMLIDPIRYCTNKNHRAVIIRRTMPELRDLIAKSQFLYKKAFPKAQWKEQDKVWTFPSGARIEFGYVENMQDAMRYQGQSYTWIGVDELPQFPTPEIWNFLRTSLRSVDPELPVAMRATGNPGNIGSLWIKEMFIDPAPPNKAFQIAVDIPLPNGQNRKAYISRRFIPAKVWDNPYLTYDDNYVATLASLNEAQRKQFLEGNWDVIEGAAFSDFDRAVHVLDPIKLPSSWPRFRACDYGFATPACCLWFAVDYDNNLYVYRELYCTRKNAEEFGRLILDLELGENIQYGVLDASVWAQRGDVGPSIAETMIRLGCRWRQSDRSPKSRINGKLEVHRRLSIDKDTNQPRLKIFSSCLNLLRTLPVLPLDDNNPEDVDTRAEDHAYDALRYGCMSRPVNPAYMQRIVPFQSLPGASSSQVADKVFGY